MIRLYFMIRYQPFTEPIMIPLTKCFWIKGYRQRMGTVETMMEAMRTNQRGQIKITGSRFTASNTLSELSFLVSLFYP